MGDEEIKEKILSGAELLFMKYGTRSISMDDIARQLGISKKTVYQHFEDKEDLITSVSQAHFEREKVQYREVKENSRDAIDELFRISGCLRKDFEDINPTLLYDIQKYHPRTWEQWLDFKNNFIREFVISNLNQGIKEGYFRPEINPVILTVARLIMVELVFDERNFPKEEFNLTEVQLEIFDHFVHGLLTEKGRKKYQKYKAQLPNVETIS